MSESGWEVLEPAVADERRRFRLAASILAMAAVGLTAVALLVIAGDRVPHDDDDALMQALWLELTLVAGWLALSAAAMCFAGVRQGADRLFARVPGSRIWLAYAFWLAFSGFAYTIVAIICGVAFTTPQDLHNVDGAREAFGWLFIRGPFFMIGGLAVWLVALGIAVIARAVITAVQGRRGHAAKDEVAAAKYLVGILMLVVWVFAFPISMALAGNPTQRLVFGLTFAVLIISTTLFLLWIARRAERTATSAGTPKWTRGSANTQLSPELFAAAGIGLLLLLARAIGNELGDAARTGEILLVCDATACSPAAMTLAGWLVITLPSAVIIVTAARWRRLARPARIALLVVMTPLLGHALLFIPGRRSTFGEIAGGPGSDQVAGGLTSAVAGVTAVLVWLLAAWLLRSRPPLVGRKWTVVTVAVILPVVALGVGIERAGPSMERAEGIFPTVLRMNGDTLTRTMARNQRGCSGILPDDALMNKQDCLITVHAMYLTDNSDAVVTIHATRYRDPAAARAVLAGLSTDMRPVATSGDFVATISASYSWVMIATAGHADGRLITQDEQGWVRWPLRQVSVHFVNTRTGLRFEPKPNTSTGPKT